MSNKTVSNKTIRQIVRLTHLVLGIAMGALIYSPLYDARWYLMSVRVIATPIVLLSGIALWQQAHINKWLKHLQTSLLGEHHP